MRGLLPLPVVLPLAGAGVSMALARWSAAQRVLGVAVVTAVTGLAVALLVGVETEGRLVTQFGGWPAPIGITFIADRLSAIMLIVGSAMVLGVLLFAIGQGAEAELAAVFHPVYLVLAAGVSAAFLTGDLFNLFVAFEVLLSASYVLITLGGRPEQVRAGMTYVVMSLLASILFLTTLALVYAATGTVNLADLAGRMAELPEALRLVLALLLLVVFGLKAAVFPLSAWLPDAYPIAPAPVTAVFAALLTKVGVYALIRADALLVGPGGLPRPLLLTLAAATMLTGILGALAQDDLKRVLSFNLVAGVGFMLFGMSVGTRAGLAATIFYAVHHIVVITALFLVAGLIEQDEGTGGLHELGALARRAPVIAVLFGLSALSLAGIPPFSGFLGKVALVQAGLDAPTGPLVAGVVVVLLASVLTLYSMARTWSVAFWRPPASDALVKAAALAPRGQGASDLARRAGLPEARSRGLMTAATVAVVVLGLVLAVAGGPLYDLADRAAEQVRDVAGYREAVLGR